MFSIKEGNDYFVYVISRISIPDYIEATGKPFFDRKESLEQRK